ncbi:NADH dehydrogenase [ubiquinone] iron-sulfur protein 5-like [Pan paniscus]|uniref:NADH dehydrogenase [ubiquinone] iron-sulfur protein 5-like n=1 Tax=Pan paniscus TaxID=9597 RepID=UPI0007DBC9E5|nr:NADH dehydrogenase [ubiquinone] iron-sulfur protein 5-like [Pan troglodytes]XP_054968210.1 NADH dehydrogenase [ubiquinone] iron-sulfur protein 5-like [Pan paniscus]
MPFLDVQKRFGLNTDGWLTIQSAEQPYKIPARHHPFEKEWRECAHGIGGIWGEKECRIEYDYFIECILWQKMMICVSIIRKQWNKLIKEGKYTPPPHHVGKGEPRPLSRVPQCWDYRMFSYTPFANCLSLDLDAGTQAVVDIASAPLCLALFVVLWSMAHSISHCPTAG